MLQNRSQRSRQPYWAVLGFIALAWACGETKDTPAGATGGASGWTFLPPGSDAHSTSGSGGVGGVASGGVAGSGVAAAGGVPLPPLTFKCGGQQPNQPIVTKFDGFMGGPWVSPGNLAGGIYIYPDKFKATAGDFLGFSDQVATYTGIGVYFNGCIDASKYLGVRFTISGDAGPRGTVRFFPVINRNRDVAPEFSVGACVPADAADPWPSCHPPEMSFPLTATPTVHTVPWSAFKGGVPTATTDGSDLLTFEWAFDWVEGDQPYAGKLKIDDVEFYSSDSSSGTGGAGGAGGVGNEAGAAGMAGAAGAP